MAGPDLQMIWLCLEFPERAEQLSRGAFHRSLRAGGELEKIGPSDIPDKDEIARQGTNGILAALQIGHEKSQVLRGVPGRVGYAQVYRAEVDGRTVPQHFGTLESGVGVTPLPASFSGEMQHGAGGLGQRMRTGNEVSVNVRLGHVSDSHAVGSRRASVLRHVRVGVDDDRFARLLARDHVARLRQVVVVKSSEKHGPFGAGGGALLDGRTVVSVLLTNSMTHCAIYHQREY